MKHVDGHLEEVPHNFYSYIHAFSMYGPDPYYVIQIFKNCNNQHSVGLCFVISRLNE